eukprot:3109171-Rhodomonas_salina.1
MGQSYVKEQLEGWPSRRRLVRPPLSLATCYVLRDTCYLLRTTCYVLLTSHLSDAPHYPPLNARPCPMNPHSSPLHPSSPNPHTAHPSPLRVTSHISPLASHHSPRTFCGRRWERGGSARASSTSTSPPSARPRSRGKVTCQRLPFCHKSTPYVGVAPKSNPERTVRTRNACCVSAFWRRAATCRYVPAYNIRGTDVSYGPSAASSTTMPLCPPFKRPHQPGMPRFVFLRTCYAMSAADFAHAAMP